MSGTIHGAFMTVSYATCPSNAPSAPMMGRDRADRADLAFEPTSRPRLWASSAGRHKENIKICSEIYV